MRQRHTMRLLCLLALVTLGSAIGCGEDSSPGGGELPAGAVARVSDTVISKRPLHSLLAAADSAPRARQQMVTYLILFEWARREAAREGLALPPKATGSEAEAGTARLLSSARSALLLKALARRATGEAPSEQQIARHYREHPQQFGAPEVRYMKLVATDSRAQANAAKQALERDESWKAVIARYSTRREKPWPGSGSMGALAQEMPDGLDEALFAARPKTFYGPVRTHEAWYVFELTAVDKLPRQSLAQARRAVRDELQRRRDERGKAALQQRLWTRYRPITTCAPNARVRLCRNGPGGGPGSVPLLGA